MRRTFSFSFCIFTIALALSSAIAQSDSEYHFRQQSVVDGHGFNNNGDPVPVLSMDCLAANGYGQWTLSSAAGMGSSEGWATGPTLYPAGWYLLGNSLQAPSVGYDSGDAEHPQCIPPGVVQCGLLPEAFPTEPEVTANLNGVVDYVWPDPTNREGFIVNQFTTSDFDLSFSFLSNPQPVVAPGTGTMDVVTSSIHTAIPEITTMTNCPHPTSNHNVVSLVNHKDEFQIASDARYLYIVWTTDSNLCEAPINEVWATVVDLTTLTTVPGWPQPLGPGIQPTVASDARNNRGFTTSPAFEAAWIITHAGHAIERRSCVGGSLGTAFSLSPTYINTSGVSKTYTTALHARVLENGGEFGGGTALYATIIDQLGDTDLVFYRPADSTDISIPASYVDGGQAAPNALMAELHLVQGNVVDNFITAFSNPYDGNDRHDGGSGISDQFHCVYQLDLGATNLGMTPGTNNPLLIVEGGDNGENDFGNNGIYASVDTRLILNQTNTLPDTLLTSPIMYVGAVNQMGIHIHWRTGAPDSGTHYYARDMNRTFDEDIDENTLVTDSCTVSNGTAHDGTVGASLTATQLSIWSDPNYGPPSKDGARGLFTPRVLGAHNEPVGRLIFSGDSVGLTINGYDCGGDAGTICSRTLTTMPFFYFDFPGTAQYLDFDFRGIFDYYGLYATHDSLGNLRTKSTPFTDGTNDERGGGTINLDGSIIGDEVLFPSTLNIHAGSDFYTDCGSQGTNLNALGGVINVDYDSSVYPTTSGSPNHSVTGHATLYGVTNLTTATLQGNVPYMSGDPGFARRVIVTVDSSCGYEQFLATGCNIFNSDNRGTSEIDFGHANSGGHGIGFGYCKFEGCSCDAIEIHGIDPSEGTRVSSLIIDNNFFNDIRNKCILVENDQNPTTAWYGFDSITNNTFAYFAPDVDDWTVSDEPIDTVIDRVDSITFIPQPFGIYLRNFNSNATGPWDEDHLQYFDPVIAGNIFVEPFNTNWNLDLNIQSHRDRAQYGSGSSAIALENTSAMVIDNTISDNGYSVGIGIRADILITDPPQPLTYSVLCSNTITGMKDQGIEDDSIHPADGNYDEYGISSTTCIGVFSLNTIVGNDVGIISQTNDEPFLLGNLDTGNREGALDVNVGGTGKLAFMGTVPPWSNGSFNTFSGPPDFPMEEESTPVISFEGSIIYLDYGHNNIFTSKLPDLPFYPLIFGVTTPTGYLGMHTIDSNFWGTLHGLIDPNFPRSPADCYACVFSACQWNTTGDGEYDALAAGGDSIYYDADTGGAFTHLIPLPADASCPGSVSCNGCASSIEPKGDKLSSILDDTVNCDSLMEKIYLVYEGDNAWQLVYDSSKKYIENCYNQPLSPDMFEQFTAAMQSLAPSDTSLWLSSRLWLESVLYLNTTNPEYFCKCIEAIGATFNSLSDTTETLNWDEENRAFAIEEWAIQNTTCDTPVTLSEALSLLREEQRQQWLNDTTVPWDTTIPPLDSVQPGLLELLQKHLLYESVPMNYSSILSNASAYPNPTGSGTIISFGTSKEAYIVIELFDVLGHPVTSVGFQNLIQEGNHEVPLSLDNLPSGTYFARIQTNYGEAQSVKIVKE